MDIERIVVRMTADASQYLRVFDVVEARLVSFGGFLAENMVRSAMKLAMEFERMGIAFEVMTGAAEKGKKVLADIIDLAVRTPFTSQELVKSAKQAMAFGFEMNDIIPVLSRLGDVSVATGSDMDRLILALGQVRTTGRLMGQELRQFTNAGVPILQYLAKAMGVAEAQVPQMVRMGAVGFNDVARAFNLMTNAGGRFFGMMERTNLETVFGRWQNFTESIQIFSRRVGEEIFKAFDVKTLLSDITNWMQSFDLNKLREQMEGIRDTAKAVWNILAGAVGAVHAWLEANPGVAKLLGLVLAVAGAFKVVSLAMIAVNSLLGLAAGFFAPLIGSAGFLFKMLWLLVSPLNKFVIAWGWVGAAVAAVLGYLTLLGKNVKSTTGFVDGLFGFLGQVGTSLQSIFAGVAEFVGGFLVGAIEQVIRSVGRLVDGFASLSDVWAGAGRGMMAAFAADDLELGFKIALAGIKVGFKTLWEWVKMEWNLMWGEMMSNLQFGLAKALVTAIYWMGIQLTHLADHIPGLEGLAARRAPLERERDDLLRTLEGDRLRAVADAARVANDRMAEFTRTLRASGEVAELEGLSRRGRLWGLMGSQVTQFWKPLVEDRLFASRAQFDQQTQLPVGAASGLIGPAVLQAQYRDLFTTAFNRVFDLQSQQIEFEAGRIPEDAWRRLVSGAADAVKNLQQFRETIGGVGAAARRAAAEISMAFEISPQTRAWLLDLTKDFAKGATAFETFRKEMGMWEEAITGPWRTRDRAAAAMGGLGAAAFAGRADFAPAINAGGAVEGFALNQIFNKLRQSVPNPQDRRPPAALQGSREAAEIIGRAQDRTLTVQEQVRSILFQSQELHRQQVMVQQQIADEMRRAAASGLIIPLPVKPN